MILIEASVALLLMAAPESSQVARTDYAGHCVSRGASEASGDLRIYDSETQVGTIAQRRFRDDRGRVFLYAYYSLPMAAPAREHWPLRSQEKGLGPLLRNDIRQPGANDASLRPRT